jgi:hypothetical protein
MIVQIFFAWYAHFCNDAFFEISDCPQKEDLGASGRDKLPENREDGLDSHCLGKTLTGVWGLLNMNTTARLQWCRVVPGFTGASR